MKSSTKLALLALLGLILVIFLSQVFKAGPSNFLIKGVDFSHKWSFSFNDSKPDQKLPYNQELQKIIDQNLEGKTGFYAAVIESLVGEQKHYYNSTESLAAASLYKLFLLAAAYQEIENGQLKEGDIITSSVSHLEQVLEGTDFAYQDYDQDKISYKVSEILKRITTISDNYAAIMLAEKLGWDKLQHQADKIGTKSTIIQSPITTSAADIALFFNKLYQKQIVSQTTSEAIIDLLSASQLNNRIPAKLPERIKIAHKTGELARVRHDAGIVFLDNHPYLIVLMSKDLKDENEGIEVIANISKDIYDYFLTL